MLFKIKIQNTWLKMLLLATITFSMLFFYSIPAFSGNIQLGDSLSKAEKYFLERKLDSAKILYSLVLDKDPKNVNALIGMAKIEFTQKIYEDYIRDRSLVQERIDLNPRTGKVKWYGMEITKYSNTHNMLKEIRKIYPSNLELNYFLAVLYRDMYKLELSGNGELYVESAKKCFDFFLAQDSAYKDALMQYAYLACWTKDYCSALDLIKKQIKIDRDKPDYYFALLKIARVAFNDLSKKEILKYLDSDASELNRFLLLEYKRYSEDFDEAESGFQEMALDNNGFIPKALLYRSMIRICARKEDRNKLYDVYKKMIGCIDKKSDADIIFRDLGHIATKEEYSNFEKSNETEVKNKFFPIFWNKRSAQSVSPIDKIYEHYSRIIYSEENYFHDRELFSFFKPMDSYSANKDFYDFGLIYIKYGKPDKTFQSTEETFCERWLYYPSSNAGLKAFGFIGPEKILLRNPYNNEVLEDMKRWDSKYNKLVYKPNLGESEGEKIVISNMVDEDIKEEAKKSLLENLAEERTEINLAKKHIVLNYQAYRFKGKDNKVGVFVSYFHPIPQIFKELPVRSRKFIAECGYSFYDHDWNLIAKRNDSVVYDKNINAIYPEIKFVSFETDTGIVNSALFCNPVGTGIACFNKCSIVAPEFSKKELCASDIMISIEDNRISGYGKKWNKHNLLPSPTNKWSLKKPVKLYYEIYNLKKNHDGKTMYHVQQAFKFKGKDENLFSKLFKKENNEVVSTEYSQTGKETELNECIAFDVSRLLPGNYVVEIMVKDINSGKSVVLQKEIELF